MSDPETLPAGVHPEVELLPWYATGTLGEEDRQRVARHLESCRECRRELEDLSELRRALTELSRQETAPSARLSRSVMARVAADSMGREVPHEEMTWVANLDRWVRSLFMPQWVPTMAAALLLAQMGLLIWVTLPPADRGEVSTRSVGTQMPSPTIRIEFQPSATEQKIRSLLQRVHGRVIDGPTAAGVFTIVVSGGDPAAVLTLLREERDVIRSADLVQP